MKRHLVFPKDFDSRALILEDPKESWAEEPKKLHAENRIRLVEALQFELGPLEFSNKLQNFKDAGYGAFSIISHHNLLYRHARYAFIHGFYYPALVAACALGERILNHLLLDLREHYKATEEYRLVYRKSSFDDWPKAIAILKSWGVFQAASVEGHFLELLKLRNKSIHFNSETYRDLRADTLAALHHLREIISGQFGFAGTQEWMIPGTRGGFFIKKSFEAHPFMRMYYLPQCPLVGPYYAVRFEGNAAAFYDRPQYEEEEISDEEFCEFYNSRTPEMLVNPGQSSECVLIKKI